MIMSRRDNNVSSVRMSQLFLALAIIVSAFGLIKSVSSIEDELIRAATETVSSSENINYNNNNNNRFVLMEKAHHNHTGTTIIGRADQNIKHQITIALKQNLDSLTERLSKITSLSDSEYGKYLHAKDTSALARPPDVSHVAVLQELSSFPGLEITKISPFGDYIHLKAPISVLEQLLQTEFYVLKPTEDYIAFVDRINNDISKSNSKPHDPTVKTELEEDSAAAASDAAPSADASSKTTASHLQCIRAFHYYLPTALAQHVGAVFGTIQHPFAVNRASFSSIGSSMSSFDDAMQPLPKKLSGFTGINSNSNSNSDSRRKMKAETGSGDLIAPIIGYVYPALLASHYSYGEVDLGTFDGTIPSQIVYAGANQYLSQSDLAMFQTEFLLPHTTIQSVNDHVIDGACKDAPQCFEANLDIEYISAISPQTPTVLWYEPDLSSSAFTLFVAAVNELEAAPGVVTVSYAMLEVLLAASDKYYFDVEASKLALRGVTLIAAAGDNGVAGMPSSLACGYNPLFPASSPFVTAIGGTFGMEYGKTESVSEGDWGEPFTTGGGFSNQYKTPWWQHSAVKGYFEQLEIELNDSNGVINHFPVENRKSPESFIFQSKYNRNGRGYPDLSLAATHFIIAVNNSDYVVSGTSCAAPVFAGLISLINLERSLQNKGTVGWINPILYSSNESITFDLPTGNNKCYSANECCVEGFFSTFGWDPVSGLGAVDYPSLRRVLVALPYTMDQNTDSHRKDFDLTSGKVSKWWTVSSALLLLCMIALLLTFRFISEQSSKRPTILSAICNTSQSNSPLIVTTKTTITSSASNPTTPNSLYHSRSTTSYGSNSSSRSSSSRSNNSNGIGSRSTSPFNRQYSYGAVSASDDIELDRFAFVASHNNNINNNNSSNSDSNSSTNSILSSFPQVSASRVIDSPHMCNF